MPCNQAQETPIKQKHVIPRIKFPGFATPTTSTSKPAHAVRRRRSAAANAGTGTDAGSRASPTPTRRFDSSLVFFLFVWFGFIHSFTHNCVSCLSFFEFSWKGRRTDGRLTLARYASGNDGRTRTRERTRVRRRERGSRTIFRESIKRRRTFISI